MPSTTPSTPPLPLPISRISQNLERYFLYDSTAITFLRREHHILGVLVGTLPQIPQQNVFLGIPLELQPEEARLLVEKGIAYIVDDLQRHKHAYSSMTASKKTTYRNSLRSQGEDVARASAQVKETRSLQALQKAATQRPTPAEHEPVLLSENDSLFTPPSPSHLPRPPSPAPSHTSTTPWLITPSTSSLLPLPTPPASPLSTYPLPTVSPPSYALFAHLHTHSYYLSPGLRFGCQFLVYPGDPLRFHSHFLANGLGWDEEIELLDLVGGGRLGTGVKKGWLVGGREEGGGGVVEGRVQEEGGGKEGKGGDDRGNAEGGGAGKVRTFCIEWGGM